VVFEQVRLFNTDGLVLRIFLYSVRSVIEADSLLFQNASLVAKNFYELRFLLLQEINSGRFRQIQSIYEAGISLEASFVDLLNSQGSCVFQRHSLLVRPPLVHVVADHLRRISFQNLSVCQ
jgi:hypothetical protein